MNNRCYEPESGALTVKYQPDQHNPPSENPPRFSWMPAAAEEDGYILQVSADPGFTSRETTTYQPVPYNFFTPHHAFAPGTYYWRYALLTEGGKRTDWSTTRSFHLRKNLPVSPLPDRMERYRGADKDHPRLWLNNKEITRFRSELKDNANYCEWEAFMAKSVLPWTERKLVAEPERYPGHRRVAHLWRQMYIDCQEVLYAVRHLSVAGVILDDADLIESARTWLLHAASWDTEGTTSRDYNDEASFRVAGALAWGYDWLYEYLDESARQQVMHALVRRTEQIAMHVMHHSRIHRFPYDSHAVRSLSSVLIPCCIALLHEEPRARDWLDYAVEYFAGLYPPWGGEDGGWAEGPMYWTTQLAYVLDGLQWLKKYTGIDLFGRPFFQHTGDFPLYCFSPDTTRASFCDQSTLGDPPSLKTGYIMRQLAGITGNGLYQWYYEQVKDLEKEPDSKFYNYGWWDFRFDAMAYYHDFPAIEAVVPKKTEQLKWFKDIGWAAVHVHMEDPEQHIMYLTKSSSYGSISHSHGDQNAFLLHAYGDPLAITSGYYKAFGSTMHLNWRRQTLSTNSLLIDGKGQYAGRNKALNLAARGSVEKVKEMPDGGYIRCNATPAYREHVPYLRRFVRETHFFGDAFFVLVDHVDLEQPAAVEWLFHSLYPANLQEHRFTLSGKKADLTGEFVYCSSGPLHLSQHSEFIGVDPSETEGLDKQWHLAAKTPLAANHRIVTLLVPAKKGENHLVFHFTDDQDHGVYLYFTGRGSTHCVEVPKVY